VPIDFIWLTGSRSTNWAKQVSLICVNEFPGIEVFEAFGELNEEQLAALFSIDVKSSPQLVWI